MADYKPYIDVGDLLMNGCSPTELESALCCRHKCTLSDEFLQVVQGNPLHAEGMLYGAEVDVPQVETILAEESVPRYGTLAGELQEYPVEVECSHLKEQAGNLLQAYAARYMRDNMHKRKIMYKLTLDAMGDNTWRTTCG